MRDGAAVATPRPFERVAPPSGCVLIVANVEHTDRYPTDSFAKLTAQTTRDAIATVERRRPTVVVIEWGCDGVDKPAICRMAANFPTISLLASMADAADAPTAIKAGCQAILLEPIAPQLAMMRIARLAQAVPPHSAMLPAHPTTYRRWPYTVCPSCAVSGVASFEMATRRTLWFACLRCDHVWTARPAC